MHISDGVLPTTITVGAYVVSGAVTAWSIRKTRGDDLPKIAVVTASFFVASLIHVPLGPTSVHLLIPGLVGILLGNSAFVAVALGLTLQSLLFQFGGITALGANSLMMGLPALFAGWLFHRLKGHTRMSYVVAGGVVGGLGTALAALFLGLLLFAAGEDFWGVAKLALVAHIPVIVVEIVLSAFVVSFLYRVKPELIGAGSFMEDRPEGSRVSSW